MVAETILGKSDSFASEAPRLPLLVELGGVCGPGEIEKSLSVWKKGERFDPEQLTTQAA